MQTLIKLSAKEVEKVELSCRLISDRQYSDETIDQLLEDCRYVAFGRMDMYWVECHLNGEDLGAFSIEPNLAEVTAYSISRNHNNVQGPELGERVQKWFVEQPEYQQQIAWMQAIVDRCFTPVGGRESWRLLSEQRRLSHEEHKINVCKKYRTQFDRLVDSGQTFDATLDSLLSSVDVYRNTPSKISTFGHLLWVFKTHVRGKPVETYAYEQIEGIIDASWASAFLRTDTETYTIKAPLPPVCVQYNGHRARAISIDRLCKLTCIFTETSKISQ